MSGKSREQAAQRRTKAMESIQQELQACAWSVGRRQPIQVCGDEPFKEGLYEMRPKQAAPLWLRRRKKREREKERKEKALWSLEWGVACWTWISNSVQSSCYSSEEWKNGQRRSCFREISYCFRDENRDLYLLLSLEISFRWV